MRLLVLLLLCVALAHAGSFWHVADIHWDPLYLVGAPVRFRISTIAPDSRLVQSICKKSDYIMCCENNSIADGSAPPAGLFGSYACDSPLPLVHSVLNFMNSTENGNVTFVLWTGDDTPVRAYPSDGPPTLMPFR